MSAPDDDRELAAEAARLAAWLDARGGPLPEGVDADVVQAALSLRPALAPPPRLTADDILADVSFGPLVALRAGAPAAPPPVPVAVVEDDEDTVPVALIFGEDDDLGVAPAPAATRTRAAYDPIDVPLPANNNRGWVRWMGASAVGTLAAAVALLLVYQPAPDRAPAALEMKDASRAAAPALESAPPAAAPKGDGESRWASEAPAEPAPGEPGDAVVDAEAEKPAEAEEAPAAEEAKQEAALDEGGVIGGAIAEVPPGAAAQGAALTQTGTYADEAENTADGDDITEVLQAATAAGLMEDERRAPAKEDATAKARTPMRAEADMAADAPVGASAGAPPPPPAAPASRESTGDWRSTVEPGRLAAIDRALAAASGLASGGDRVAAANSLRSYISAPARAGQHVAYVAATWALDGGDPALAQTLATQGVRLGGGPSPELSALQGLVSRLRRGAQ
jgi:hypothetical protein